MKHAPLVKICGVTRAQDAVAAVNAGADWLGLNFYSGSPRYVEPARAAVIASAARKNKPGVAIVGVFVNAPVEEMQAVADSLALDYIQLHGNESVETCAVFGDKAIKAFRLTSEEDVEAATNFPCLTILVDAPSAAYGGSGRLGDWSLAANLAKRSARLMLAGGLNPDNVAAAVSAVLPFAVDVASGVESAPGEKDPEKMRRFVLAARGLG